MSAVSFPIGTASTSSLANILNTLSRFSGGATSSIRSWLSETEISHGASPWYFNGTLSSSTVAPQANFFAVSPTADDKPPPPKSVIDEANWRSRIVLIALFSFSSSVAEALCIRSIQRRFLCSFRQSILPHSPWGFPCCCRNCLSQPLRPCKHTLDASHPLEVSYSQNPVGQNRERRCMRSGQPKLRGRRGLLRRLLWLLPQKALLPKGDCASQLWQLSRSPCRTRLCLRCLRKLRNTMAGLFCPCVLVFRVC